MAASRFKVKYQEFRHALKNEYSSIFHDAGVILIVVGALFIYSTIYSLAYKQEVLRNVPIAIVDMNNTAASRQLVRAMDATPNLDVVVKPTSLEEAKELFMTRKVYGVVYIPNDYEKKVLSGGNVNLGVYADASYFLMYRQVFFDVTASVLTTGAQIEWLRFVSQGISAAQADVLVQPVITKTENMFNPYLGYASFVMPAILMVIIQQTMLVGIGMVGGTWREKKLYRNLIPVGEKRLSVMPLVMGRSLAYLSIYTFTVAYLLGVHYKIFNYPMNGRVGDLVLFLIPYLLSCVFFGVALSTVFKRRENSLIALLFTSIPQLMLSGASVPEQCMPEWLFMLGKVLPSSSGVDAFIRIQTMGATIAEVRGDIITLWILTGVYFVLACAGMRRVILKTEEDEQEENMLAEYDATSSRPNTPIVPAQES